MSSKATTKLAQVLMPVGNPGRGFFPADTRSRWRNGVREPRASQLMLLAAEWSPQGSHDASLRAEELAAHIMAWGLGRCDGLDDEANSACFRLYRLAMACIYAADAAAADAMAAQAAPPRVSRQFDLEEMIASRSGSD